MSYWYTRSSRLFTNSKLVELLRAHRQANTHSHRSIAEVIWATYLFWRQICCERSDFPFEFITMSNDSGLITPFVTKYWFHLLLYTICATAYKWKQLRVLVCCSCTSILWSENFVHRSPVHGNTVQLRCALLWAILRWSHQTQLCGCIMAVYTIVAGEVSHIPLILSGHMLWLVIWNCHRDLGWTVFD